MGNYLSSSPNTTTTGDDTATTQTSTNIELININSSNTNQKDEEPQKKIFGKTFWIGGQEFPSLEAYVFGNLADYFFMVLRIIYEPAESKPFVEKTKKNSEKTKKEEDTNVSSDFISSVDVNERRDSALPPEESGSENTGERRENDKEDDDETDDISSDEDEPPVVGVLKNPVHAGKEVKLQRDSNNNFNFTFTMDSLSQGTATLFFMATEIIEEQTEDKNNSKIWFQSEYPNSSLSYNAGFNQTLTINLDHVCIDEIALKGKELSPEDTEIGAVLLLDSENCNISEISYYKITESGSIGNYIFTIIKQKCCDGLVSYVMLEIYGLEAKEEKEASDDDSDDDDFDSDEEIECVICMSNPKNTVILPCRHLCLCQDCAKILRNQTGKCAICRMPFHSLLELKLTRSLKSLKSHEQPSNEDEIVEIDNDRKLVIPLVKSKSSFSIKKRESNKSLNRASSSSTIPIIQENTKEMNTHEVYSIVEKFNDNDDVNGDIEKQNDVIDDIDDMDDDYVDDVIFEDLDGESSIGENENMNKTENNLLPK